MSNAVLWFLIGVFVTLMTVAHDEKIAFIQANDGEKVTEHDGKLYKLKEINE